MRTGKNVLKSLFGKAGLAATLLGGALFFAAVPGAQARTWDERPPIRVVSRYEAYGPRRVFVRRGYYAPRYYGPRYYAPRVYGPRFYGPRVVVGVHGFRDRYGYWHR